MLNMREHDLCTPSEADCEVMVTTLAHVRSTCVSSRSKRWALGSRGEGCLCSKCHSRLLSDCSRARDQIQRESSISRQQSEIQRDPSFCYLDAGCMFGKSGGEIRGHPLLRFDRPCKQSVRLDLYQAHQ